MDLKPKNYRNRIIDKQIEEELKIFPALSIEGPKWCGKTWTAMAHAKSAMSLDKEHIKQAVELSVDAVFTNVYPQLIDEWSRVPKIWDAVRSKSDELGEPGKFILTCSTKLNDENWREKIFHSGAGRFEKIKMRTMSLYESGDSLGQISLSEIYNNNFKVSHAELPKAEDLAYYIVRGGWPANINASREFAHRHPSSYCEMILNNDINDDKLRNRSQMELLMRSLARNESSIAKVQTLINDSIEICTDSERELSRFIIDDYIDVLRRIYVIEDQPVYSKNYRSPDRVGKLSVRRFTDPSLACVLLKLNTRKLANDLNTLGLMFESLVIRDLRIYMQALNGMVYHFRDNVTGNEVDAILEFEDGDYAAVEIKLGDIKIQEGIKSLLKFKENTETPPKFMMIIVGIGNIAYRDETTGIYIVPITMLKD